jgi:hypothetical protein
MSDLVLIAQYNRRYEAEQAAGYLEDAEIPATVQADDAGGADLGLSFSRQARVRVRAEDAEEAREVLRSAGMEVHEE